MKKVLIYSTPTCGFCKLAKSFFQEHQIQYEDFDVAADQQKAQEMVQKSGQMGVPVIVITDESGKEEIIVGFNKEKLEEVLSLK